MPIYSVTWVVFACTNESNWYQYQMKARRVSSFTWKVHRTHAYIQLFLSVPYFLSKLKACLFVWKLAGYIYSFARCHMPMSPINGYPGPRLTFPMANITTIYPCALHTNNLLALGILYYRLLKLNGKCMNTRAFGIFRSRAICHHDDISNNSSIFIIKMPIYKLTLAIKTYISGCLVNRNLNSIHYYRFLSYHEHLFWVTSQAFCL